jgi:hypothetical protein
MYIYIYIYISASEQVTTESFVQSPFLVLKVLYLNSEYTVNNVFKCQISFMYRNTSYFKLSGNIIYHYKFGYYLIKILQASF